MSYEMKVGRNMRGELEAVTKIPLGEKRRELHVRTGKAVRGGLVVFSNVGQVSEDGLGFSYMLYGDFRERLALEPNKRATEKNVREVHAAALLGIEAVLERVKAFYAAKEAEVA